MLIVYLIIVTLIILVLSGAIPFIQFLLIKRKPSQPRYTFSAELLNYDWDLDTCEDDKLITRKIVATRGWVRGPQGNAMTEQSFQEKRTLEYSIDLP